MGVVIPFEPRARLRAHVADRPADLPADLPADGLGARTSKAALREDAGSDEVLAAAGPLIRLCRDRYGFTIMRDGLPSDPDVLGSALLNFSLGLALLEPELAGRPASGNFGVYLGRPDLSWFEDGFGGMTGLAVPADVDPEALAYFVRPRLKGARRI